MSKASENKEQFKMWFEGQTSKISISFFIDNFEEVCRYACSHGVCKDDFWEVDDYKKFNFIRSKLSGDRFFKKTQKSLFTFFERFSKLYSTYLKNRVDSGILDNGNSEIVKEITDDCLSIENSDSKHFKMPGFDIYESAILLDAYLHVADGSTDKQRGIEAVSKKLRAMAVNKGQVINESYRNISGISTQMTYMRVAFTGVDYCRTPSTIFREIISIYNNDRERYNYILDKANRECGADCFSYSIENQVTERIDNHSEFDSTLLERYTNILRTYFPNGIRSDSIIDYDKFSAFYFDEYGEEHLVSDNDFKRILHYVGTYIGDRVYPRDDHNDAIPLEIICVINDAFKEDEKFHVCASYIYIERLYDRFKDALASSCHIYNQNDFCKMLGNIIPKCYYIKSDKLYKIGNNATLRDEIIAYMKPQYRVITLDELEHHFWYITSNVIKYFMNDTPQIIRLSTIKYIYADNVLLSKSDLDIIENVISDKLLQYDYVSVKTVKNELEIDYPLIMNSLVGYSDKELENIFKFLLNDKFSFKGMIISPIDFNTNEAEILENFCRSKTILTIKEIKEYTKSVNIRVRWEYIYNVMVRVNDSSFMRNDQVEFDITKVDELLFNELGTGYCAIKDFNVFILPSTSVPWNYYLLESYVYNHSMKFRLIHPWFTGDGGYGAIVSNDSKILDFSALILDIFLNAFRCHELDIDVNSENAMKYLVSKSYIKRNAHSDTVKEALDAARFKVKSSKD